MHEVVLHDPTLMRHAGQFVWLALNYDSADAAPIIEKYQAQSIPVLLVVDAASETVRARVHALSVSGAIVVVATHDLDLADGLVTRVAILRGGKLVTDEPAARGLRARYRSMVGH